MLRYSNIKSLKYRQNCTWDCQFNLKSDVLIYNVYK